MHRLGNKLPYLISQVLLSVYPRLQPHPLSKVAEIRERSRKFPPPSSYFLLLYTRDKNYDQTAIMISTTLALNWRCLRVESNESQALLYMLFTMCFQSTVSHSTNIYFLLSFLFFSSFFNFSRSFISWYNQQLLVTVLKSILVLSDLSIEVRVLGNLLSGRFI